MKLTRCTIAATFAALPIGGLVISPASAANRATGRVDMSTHDGFELNGVTSYNNGRSAPNGTQPILKSNARGMTNGRKG